MENEIKSFYDAKNCNQIQIFCNPDKYFSPVALIDVAKVYLSLIDNSKKHKYSVYTLRSDRLTYNQISEKLSEFLKKKIKLVVSNIND